MKFKPILVRLTHYKAQKIIIQINICTLYINYYLNTKIQDISWLKLWNFKIQNEYESV